jgi:hypothetical protein
MQYLSTGSSTNVEYTTESGREQSYYEVQEGGIHKVNSAASRNEWNLRKTCWVVARLGVQLSMSGALKLGQK